MLRWIFHLKFYFLKEFLVLDSSTEDKFSAHVICHLPNGVLFPSNVGEHSFFQLPEHEIHDKWRSVGSCRLQFACFQTAIRPFSVKLAEALLEDAPAKIWNSDGTKVHLPFLAIIDNSPPNYRNLGNVSIWQCRVHEKPELAFVYVVEARQEQCVEAGRLLFFLRLVAHLYFVSLHFCLSSSES